LGTFPNAGGFGGSMEMATCRWNIALFFPLDHVESFMVGVQLMRIFDWPVREKEKEVGVVMESNAPDVKMGFWFCILYSFFNCSNLILSFSKKKKKKKKKKLE
jgi:hypothetical protein